MNQKSILLIEDNLEMRENTGEILELANYEVLTAENGKQGVKLAKEHHPDLIVCDIMMPVLDGYGVLYMLSKDPETSSIPFIFLTAKAEKSDFRKGMNLGADDYLTKPFEEMELLEAVESRLKRSEAFRKEFKGDIDGLNQFINEARGLEELKKLSENRPQRTYKKKESIFQEGDYPNFLFFLNKGKIKTYKLHDDGKEYITGLYKPGEFLGYVPLLEGNNYQEYCEALEESELYRIPKEDFLALIHNNRDVASRFIKMLTGNIADKESQLISLAYNTVRKRVAEALLLLQKRYREEGAKNDFKLTISRDDLASIVGTATESVIRTLSDFREEKLIRMEGRSIVIQSSEGLEKIW